MLALTLNDYDKFKEVVARFEGTPQIYIVEGIHDKMPFQIVANIPDKNTVVLFIDLINDMRPETLIQDFPTVIEVTNINVG